MKLDALMIDDGPAVYYTTEFRNVLEDHMTYLRSHSGTTVLDIEPIQAYRFEGDLGGLLGYYNIPAQLHWLVMRMNNYTSPLDTTADISVLMIPNSTTVDQIRQSFMSDRRII